MFFYRIMLFESLIIDFLELLPGNRLKQDKKRVRELLAQKRRLLSKEDIAEQSSKVVAAVEQMPSFQSAKTVLIYYPTHNEVDLLSLIKRYKKEKTFLFPVVHRKTMTACPYEGNAKMHRGKFNIPEPTTEPYVGDIDLILVPGVGFDKRGNRLGRGGGYYDKFITRLGRKTLLVGVGYDFQLVEEVPANRWDKRLDYVVTPSNGTIKTKRD
jgi:5-formyltetrahydrofolate cyclo-ligase